MPLWWSTPAVTPLRIFFFFQAEDGIRDHCVTGVQTCALPISDQLVRFFRPHAAPLNRVIEGLNRGGTAAAIRAARALGPAPAGAPRIDEPAGIGRASCRERGEISVGPVSLKKKKEMTKDAALV